MSQIQVDNIYNKEATGSPSFPLGANVTGVITATTFKGGAEITSGTINATSATFSGAVSVGGTLTYEDVTNIDSVGVITARNGVKVTAGGLDIVGGGINAVGVVTATNDIKANGNIIGDSSTNISGVSSVTATTYYGSGASLTGIDAAPQVKVNASGSISAGNAVVANTDGTVSKIGLSYTAIDPITRLGCPTELNYPDNSTATADWLTCQLEDNYMAVAWNNDSAPGRIDVAWVKVDGATAIWSTNYISLTGTNGTLLDLHYDPTRNQAVVVFKKNDDKVYFRTLRRNPGATSISAGTEQQLNNTAAWADVKLSYDTAANKFLVVYGKDPTQSNYCTAQVMTVVDNDTFTFGSLVTIKSNQCAHIATDFDTSAGKHLVLYRDNSVSNDCYGIVATVSGTNVTFGTAVELETGNNEGAKIEYSTTDGKFLWLSLNESGGEVDVSVLTISGTSVSRGTNTTITTNTAGMNTGTMAISYEPNLDVFYILYRNNYVGKWRTATMSGTNVSVGSENNTRCAANSLADCDIGFDKGSGKTFLVGQNGGTNAGLYQVWTTATSTTNVTAENYIGVSDGNYTNGQLATIKLSGNTDNNQVGLTTGQSYFAQNDGTISLTAASPQVFVGNAVSSTKLVLASPVAPPTPPVWEHVTGTDFGSLSPRVSEVNFTGFTTSYSTYKIQMTGVMFVNNSTYGQGSATTDKIRLRFLSNGTYQTSNEYYHKILRYDGGGSPDGDGSTSTYAQLSPWYAEEMFSGFIEIPMAHEHPTSSYNNQYTWGDYMTRSNRVMWSCQAHQSDIRNYGITGVKFATQSYYFYKGRVDLYRLKF